MPDLAARLRCASPKEADALTASILASSGLPNAYCLTKHMAERLVAESEAEAAAINAGTAPIPAPTPSVITPLVHQAKKAG